MSNDKKKGMKSPFNFLETAFVQKNEKRSENHDTQRIWSPVRQSTPNDGCPCVNEVTTSLHVATNIKPKLAKVCNGQI